MTSLSLPNQTPLGGISKAEQRSMVIDLLKAVASQFIVLHHLVAYGPLATDVWRAAPHFIDWMYNYGRWAPQVFLVMSGYLMARGFAPSGIWSGGTLWQAIVKRYLRLILPYLAALVIAVAVTAWVRPWLGDDPSIPSAPTWRVWWAHATLMQNVMGYDALSAGVWYIAIDFQLFVLMAAVLWLGRMGLGNAPRWRYVPLVMIGLGMGASLLIFNRDQSLDNWAIYFFGSYSLGAVAFWLGQLPTRLLWRWLLVVGGLVGTALVIDFRGRLVLATIVAALLLFQQRLKWLEQLPLRGLIARMGRISYSLFLIHYPILLLANVVCVAWDIHRHGSSTVCALTAWIVCLGVASVFYRYVEAPCAKLGGKRVK